MSELGRDARDLIARVGRADLPSSADRARVWRSFVARSTAIGAGIVAAQHGAAGAVAKGATTGAASGAGASGLGAIAKVAIVVGVGVASAGGAFLASAPPSAPSAPPVAVIPAPSSRAIPFVPAAPPTTPVAPLVASTVELTLALPAPRASSVPRPSAPPRATVPTDSPLSRAENSPAANASPPSALPAPAEPAPSPTADSPAAPDQLRAEIDLIQRALSADASHDVVRLRALVDEHRVRFPNGAFSEERDVLRVLLLCAEGKRDEARALADTIHLGPRSPARLRFSRSCVAPSNLP